MRQVIISLWVLACVSHSDIKWALETAVQYWGINDRSAVQLVYTPPETALRREADRIERERKDIPRVREILERMDKDGICKD